MLEFTCAGIGADGLFLPEHTGRGANRSPAFTLCNLRPGAKTLAATLEDMSHPIPGFTHWVIWNLPAGPTVPGAIPPGRLLPGLGGAVQGMAYGLHRYAGPKPPRGRQHLYRFTLYALDGPLALGPRAAKRALLRAAAGHILQQGSLTGRFG